MLPTDWHEQWPLGEALLGLLFILLAADSLLTGTLWTKGGKVVRANNPGSYWTTFAVHVVGGTILIAAGFAAL